MNLVDKIIDLKKKKNAIILAHYYQRPEIQDVADFIGDSLALADYALKTEKDIIVLAGVKFMAETAKILNPRKKVLIPDLEAGCSLADSIKADDIKALRKKYPDALIVSYINTNIEVKSESDLICTSSNAEKVIQSIPLDKKIIFTPDKNLGNYLASKLNREMIIWDGACHVHEQFSLEKILKLKNENPDAKLLAHPECQKPILIIADFIGSTSALLKYVQNDDSSKYIVATESGIIHQMRKICPDKKFIPAPPIDSTCGCNDCNFMKLITLEKIYESLVEEKYEIIINKDLLEKAKKPLEKMITIK